MSPYHRGQGLILGGEHGHCLGEGRLVESGDDRSEAVEWHRPEPSRVGDTLGRVVRDDPGFSRGEGASAVHRIAGTGGQAFHQPEVIPLWVGEGDHVTHQGTAGPGGDELVTRRQDRAHRVLGYTEALHEICPERVWSGYQDDNEGVSCVR